MAPPPPPSPAGPGRTHSYSISSNASRPSLGGGGGELASAFGPAGGSARPASPHVGRTTRAEGSQSPNASPSGVTPPGGPGENGRRPGNERRDTGGGTPAPGGKDEPKGRMLSCTECELPSTREREHA
jgi:hypothetical protein